MPTVPGSPAGAGPDGAGTPGTGTAAPRGQARARLLDAAMAYFGDHGISDLSLRQLAEALGTSHRMLIYHFGSKEGLLTEVVRAVEQGQRTLWSELVADPELDPSERPRRLWQRVSDPELEPFARLFFEIYGQALQGREPATALLEGDIESWLAPSIESLVENGMPAGRAETMARLGLAVARGLLLDLLATGQRAAVTDAFELFLSLYQRVEPSAPPAS
ncbi:MAG TPA: TetR/AcrR family transcriptional regulator [Pseudonocardia sp.]|jgi:AcrR family transcriptional regulator|nr:TetR/AcrR family transcriptional regulator [Pseudonocardia sp.]